MTKPGTTVNEVRAVNVHALGELGNRDAATPRRGLLVTVPPSPVKRAGEVVLWGENKYRY
jgi:hypothetical protein